MKKKNYQNDKDKNLQLFLEKVRQKFGSRLKKVILFGSRARGENDEQSDYDFLFIFDKVTPQIKDFLSELATQMLLDYGMVITDLAFTEEDLGKREYEPFIINAKKEGILL